MDLLDVQGAIDPSEVANEALANETLELANEIVTVSMLKLALRAEARRLQPPLSQLGEQADTSTPEGLFELLQQIAQTLLDYSRYWTHVLATSRTVNSLEEAEILFNQFANEEQERLNMESLPEMNGAMKAVAEDRPSPLYEKSDYVVVSLLLCTADDQALFGEIYSASVLRDVLDNIRMMQARYLMGFEVLWSPQGCDSLSETDLMARYGDLVEIA
jgi:uncharacterized membrane protein